MRRTSRCRALLAGFLMAACASALYSQTTDVYGVVTDSLTKQRIPFTNVSVVGTMRGAAANNLGFYFVPKLPPGTYEIAASSIGYNRGVKTVVVREGKPVELNFGLSPVPVQTEEVVVTAPRKRLEIETQTTSVHVLERQEPKQVPVAGQQDLLRSLKILPGIVSTSDVSSRFYVSGGAGVGRRRLSLVNISAVVYRQYQDNGLANPIKNSPITNPQRPFSFQRPHEGFSHLWVLREPLNLCNDLVKQNRLGPSHPIEILACLLCKLNGQ